MGPGQSTGVRHFIHTRNRWVKACAYCAELYSIVLNCVVLKCDIISLHSCRQLSYLLQSYLVFYVGLSYLIYSDLSIPFYSCHIYFLIFI